MNKETDFYYDHLAGVIWFNYSHPGQLATDRPQLALFQLTIADYIFNACNYN